VDETSHYAQQFKDCRGNIFSKAVTGIRGQPLTVEEFCIVLAVFMLADYSEAQSETVLLTKSAGSHAHFWFYYFLGQI
jgi:hypothetical protein